MNEARAGSVHYNLIIIDVDWASDSIIAEVANYLIDNKIKSTWFITHDSPQIRKLLDNPDIFEVGIHPNLDKGSTQGANLKEIFDYLLKISPNAKSVRIHKLLQSFPILQTIREDYGIIHDASLFLPDTPNIVPHKLYFSKDVEILRFPCFWEDDAEMRTPVPSFSLSDKKYRVDGVKIFAFHPIHIVLNSYSIDNYFQLKSKVDITKCDMGDLKNYINTTTKGTGTFFREITQFIKEKHSSGLTISDLAKIWRSKIETK